MPRHFFKIIFLLPGWDMRLWSIMLILGRVSGSGRVILKPNRCISSFELSFEGESVGFMSHRIYGIGIFTYIYHKGQPHVGKHIIHGWYGCLLLTSWTARAKIALTATASVFLDRSMQGYHGWTTRKATHWKSVLWDHAFGQGVWSVYGFLLTHKKSDHDRLVNGCWKDVWPCMHIYNM